MPPAPARAGACLLYEVANMRLGPRLKPRELNAIMEDSMRLSELPWWPQWWKTKAYQDIPVQEVRTNGTLSDCSFLPA